MSQNRVFSLIGLARRSRNLVSGEFMTEKAVKEGSAALVIVADDASNNTKKKFHNMCAFYEVPIFEYGLKDDLGHAMGQEFRASLAILDQGFAKSIAKLLTKTNN